MTAGPQGRKCKPIHIRPHLDLKRRLFMHDCNESSNFIYTRKGRGA